MTAWDRVEVWLARAALWLLRRLGVVQASALGGAVARTIGPLLPVSRVADRNLRLALPELDQAARRAVVRGVWDNLGRTVAELPHMASLEETASGPGWELEGAEYVAPLAARGGPAILVTAHIGNWEVLSLAAARKGVGFASIYRPANNKGIDALIVGLRQAIPGVNTLLFQKGAHGARQMMAHLRAGGFIGMLPDQKMNDGVEARFFGHKAMTASALAALALKVDCPVLMAHTQRIGPARFRVVVEPPVPLPRSGDRAQDVVALTQAVNDRFEAWIRARPESWLWLHRRWPKEIYAGR